MIISAINVDLQNDIRHAYQWDLMALEVFKGLKHGFAPIRSKLTDWAGYDDLLYYQGKLVIPNDIPLR